ncbi:MAG: hypothetical protein OEZ22_04110 [Spirochaetia bacterium]|nr:hypothetical protein [Spirochaetia bacterium]
MKWINKISFHQNVRNETPNRELAKELYITNNIDGIKEISEYLFDKNKSIASDCIAVLYEIGYKKPDLISNYLNTFLQLLESKNNRMVWGAMIAIANISTLKAKEIFKNIDIILNVMKNGTLITEVWGIKALVGISSTDDNIKNKLLATIILYLENSRPIDFSSRLEVIIPIITTEKDVKKISNIIKKKQNELNEAQKNKLKTIVNRHNKSIETSECKIIVQ